MAKIAVTYHAPKGDEKVVETRGLTFFDGQTQHLDEDEHAEFLAKAKGNPHFHVGEDSPVASDDRYDGMSIADLRVEAEKLGVAHEGLSKAQLRDMLRG